MPAIKNKVIKAYMLADPKQALAVNQSGSGIAITLPQQPSGQLASIVCLEIDGGAVVR